MQTLSTDKSSGLWAVKWAADVGCWATGHDFGFGLPGCGSAFSKTIFEKTTADISSLADGRRYY